MTVLCCTNSVTLPRWDGNCVLFEISVGGEPVRCAISRMALEAIDDLPCAKMADLLERFAKARTRIENLALDKLHARPAGVSGRLSLWADDLDDPSPGGVCVPGRLRAAWLQSA